MEVRVETIFKIMDCPLNLFINISFQLHFKYYEKIRLIDEDLQREEEDDEDEMYLKRLAGGLFTLQLIDYIMIDVCASGSPSIKQRVLRLVILPYKILA